MIGAAISSHGQSCIVSVIVQRQCCIPGASGQIEPRSLCPWSERRAELWGLLMGPGTAGLSTECIRGHVFYQDINAGIVGRMAIY